MNGIKITVTDGATADGQTGYFFPDSKDTIVLGRDPARCDIVFAQELRERGVGSEHVALRRSLGRYRLQLNTENAVHVDGIPAFDDQEIVKSGELKLDRGATLRVEIVDERPETMAHDRPREQVGLEVQRARRWALPLASVGALLLVVVGYLYTSQSRIERAALQAVPSEVIARVTKSVYAVIIRNSAGGESSVGTAWIGPGGMVFTNAHVGEILKEVSKDQHVLIRSAVEPYRDHRVTDVRLHPGYELFARTATAYEPAQLELESPKRLELIPVADIAVFEVEDKGQLGPALTLLPESRIDSLGAGEPIAFVGFPSEGLIVGSVVKPVAISQRAQIINLTDSFLTRQADSQNRLVLHSLPATGGASGSPIVDTAGRVVAVLNAGNTVMVGGQRTPSAANIHFAQRVDYVYDMLSSDRLKSRVSLYEREWQDGLKRFGRSQDLALKAVTDQLRRQLGARGDPVVREVKAPLSAAHPQLGMPAQVMRTRMEPGLHVLFAFPSVPGDIDLKLVDGKGQLIAEDEHVNQFAIIQHEVTAAEENDLVVLHATKKPQPDMNATVRSYFWPADRLFTVEQRWIARAKQRLRTDADPASLLARTDESTGQPSPHDPGPASQFSVRLPGPGAVMFVAMPREPARFKVLVLAGDNVIARNAADKGGKAAPAKGAPRVQSVTERGGTGVIAQVPESVGELRIVVVSETPGAKFDLKGYHWLASQKTP